MKFTAMSFGQLNRIITWCKQHDWCHKAYMDNQHGVFIVEDTYDNEIIEFRTKEDLFTWAGY